MYFPLQTFGDLTIDIQVDSQRAAEISRHYRQVKINRYVLFVLINSVCFLENRYCLSEAIIISLNEGNYIELLNYRAQCDNQFQEHLQTATSFRGISLQIQNDLIPSRNSVLNDAVRDEIN